MTTKLRVSVIIPVHNGGERFRQCLSSLIPTLPATDEVIVVADGDTDGSSQVARDFKTKLIQTLRQSGPAHARNLGAKAATGDILFFVDADVVVYPHTLEQVRQAFQSYADLTALIGSYDDKPAAQNFLSQYKNLLNHYVHQTAADDASTFWGACGAIRRSVFLEMGGFDENYHRPCVEDIELGYRLKAKGYKIRLCKEIQVKHLKCWQPLGLIKSEIFDRAIPWTNLILRERQLVNDLNLKVSSRVSVVLAYSLIPALCGTLQSFHFASLSLVIIALIISINVPVYNFFFKKRGVWFTLQVLPWHWFYYFYSGLAFVIGFINYQYRSQKRFLPVSSQVKNESKS